MSNLNFDSVNTIDEDFFGSLKSSGSSKLQQLFVDDALSPNDKQQSFKYQHPKDTSISSNVMRATLMAKVVTAFRHGELQGKVGLALVQNPDDVCNIIMYRTKTKILANLKLQPGMVLLYKQTRYWQFYDEVSIYWSFSFDSVLDEKEFMDKLYINNITYKECQETENNFELPKFSQEAEKLAIENLTDKSPAGAIRETKNFLIKRIVKMGKPLPTLPSGNQQITAEFSDSSDTEVIETPTLLTHKRFLAPRNHKITINKPNQQLMPSDAGFDSVSNATNSVYSLNPLESQYMQMLLTEQRTQSSEIRININKLENKIEKVLDKLEYRVNDGNKNTEKEDDILELEEKLLMLKKENRKLKQNLEDRSTKDSEQSKIKDLLYEFKDDLKQLNISYDQDLKSVLKELSYKLKKIHNDLKEAQLHLDKNELKLKEVKTELELKTSQNTVVQRQGIELERQLIEKETEVTKLKQELLDLQQKKELHFVTPDDALIKSIMNNLYADIVEKLKSVNFLRSEDILTIVASAIKQQTLQTLQQTRPKDN